MPKYSTPKLSSAVTYSDRSDTESAKAVLTEIHHRTSNPSAEIVDQLERIPEPSISEVLDTLSEVEESLIWYQKLYEGMVTRIERLEKALGLLDEDEDGGQE